MGFFNKIFGKRKESRWESLPIPFVNEVKKRLGEEGFRNLEVLSLRYNIFNQDFFKDLSFMGDDPADVTDNFAFFLGSTGNQLAKQRHVEDAEQSFRLSLKLKASDNLARGGLAILLVQTGRRKEAAQEAKEALKVLDTAKELAELAEEKAQAKKEIEEFKQYQKKIMPLGTEDELRKILEEIALGDKPLNFDKISNLVKKESGREMGFFDFLSSYSQREKELLELFTNQLIIYGFSPYDAKKEARTKLNESIAESKKQGTYRLPQNFGDIILGIAKTNNPTIRKMAEEIREQQLPQKRAEGVRDADIRWWWNLTDIERRMMIQTDEFSKFFTFSYHLTKRGTTNEAAVQEVDKKVRKTFPIYGDGGYLYSREPDPRLKGDDCPLPFELKDRINIFVETNIKNNPEKYKKVLEKFSSVNAFIRKEIKAGNI